MDLDQARALLGVDRDADDEQIRSSYRRLLLSNHPDVTGGGPDSTARTAELNLAYRMVVDADGVTEPAPTSPTPPPTAPPRGSQPGHDPGERTIPLRAPTFDVLDALCEAADRIGDLSYVDRANGILETIVRAEGYPVSSLLITLQQAGPDTLASCTLESLDSRPGPPIRDVVDALSAMLQQVEAERAP
jgi:hypothetical protein